jgi:hypothetical protein
MIKRLVMIGSHIGILVVVIGSSRVRSTCSQKREHLKAVGSMVVARVNLPTSASATESAMFILTGRIDASEKPPTRTAISLGLTSVDIS